MSLSVGELEGNDDPLHSACSSYCANPSPPGTPSVRRSRLHVHLTVMHVTCESGLSAVAGVEAERWGRREAGQASLRSPVACPPEQVEDHGALVVAVMGPCGGCVCLTVWWAGFQESRGVCGTLALSLHVMLGVK